MLCHRKLKVYIGWRSKFIEEKRIRWGQLNTKILPLAQEVTELQIAGGWGTVMGGCFTTCFSCSHTLPTIYFGHCSMQNRWILDLTQHGSSHVLRTHCQPLNFHFWTSVTELQTFAAHSDFCLTSTDKCFRHKKQALFWTHYGEDSH